MSTLKPFFGALLITLFFAIQAIDQKPINILDSQSTLQHLIAFQTNRDGNFEIYTMNPDGSNQINLTNNPADDSGADWSPDGTKIAFTRVQNGRVDLYTMKSDGTEVTLIPSNGGWRPSWSPDGSKIAYAHFGDNYDIWVVNVDGSNPIQLTDSPAEDISPTWSPDGSKIAFRSERDGNMEVYSMDANGSNLKNLTNSLSWDEEPDWSPDGLKIAFSSNRSGYPAIWVMNSDGSEPKQLTHNPNGDSQPAWASDGKSIAFKSYRDFNDELYAMDADGSCQFQLTTNGEPGNTLPEDWFPDWRPVNFKRFTGPIKIYLPAIQGKNEETHLFQDDFSNPASGWPIVNEEDFHSEYLNGEYRLFLNEGGLWEGVTPNILGADFTAEVDVRSQSPAQSSFGILFGISEDWSELYSFDISNYSINYMIQRYDSVNGFIFIEQGSSTEILAYPQTNRLKIDRMESQIAIYVNGRKLGNLNDSLYLGLRKIGLSVKSYEPNVDVRFDNFMMKPLICSNLDKTAAK